MHNQTAVLTSLGFGSQANESHVTMMVAQTTKKTKFEVN